MSCFLFFCYFTFLQKYVLFIIPYAMADDTSPQKESMTVAGRVHKFSAWILVTTTVMSY